MLKSTGFHPCRPSGDKLQEECGVFGISRQDGRENAAYDVYTALFALQHRGQQSAGIATCCKGNLMLHKDAGLVPEVFNEKQLAALKGAAAIGHVRYSSKQGSSVDAQPIMVKHASGSVALAYNGKLVNSKQLRAETEQRGGIFQTTNDSEVISYLLVRERLRTNTTEDALINAMQYMVGAYSIVLLNDRKLIAARDPNGFRPLCMGEVDGSIMFASESCAFSALGGKLIRDVQPGEIIVAEHGKSGYQSFHCGIKARASLCVFEFIYFARPDSIIDGVSVNHIRMEAGRCLARRNTAQADVVIGVPDSGLAAAMGFAQEAGLPFSTGLVKNRYIGRTFIQPTQNQREESVRIKLNALSSTIKGKRVIMVDDSIVRGTTCAHIVSMLREAGATEVHMKSSAPPFLHPCYFGTDIPDRSKLIAHNRTIEEIRQIIGVDSLDFLPTEELSEIAKGLNLGHCDACFTGDYAVPVPKN